MTTTTDKLRRKLAELHVEYETIDGPDICFTEWSTHNGAFVFTARESSRSYGDNMLRVETCGIPKSCIIATPEQAIAATLGSCNCSNNCMNSERTGTCHDRGTFNSWGFFTCSNCSIVFPLDAVKDAPSIGRTLPPKYCPNCGRKVVDPTTNDVDAEVDA